MKKGFILLVASFLVKHAVFAQKQTTHVQQVWLAYFNQTRFSDKWGLWADVHLRTKEDFAEDLSTFIGRVGIMYYINDNAKLTAGYGYVNHFPAGATTISQPEHRPWQQFQWHTKYPKARLMQYIRLEERFRRKIENNELADGHLFNYRLRYNIFYNVPLSKNAFAPRTLSFIANDELHINFGKEIVYNYFDQNRFFIGLGYHLNARDQLQFGYMNLFQQLGSGNQYRNIHAVRVYFAHNLDVRKKE
ncbi:MAG TPA: DUF2490 domain-containing protein [Chitinophagaceae bacterium]|nr:DUF2490 domain-containing protein [Chitinophagaceae bacterium]